MSTHILPCELCEFTCVGLNRLRRHQNTHKTRGSLESAAAANKVPCYICGVELKELVAQVKFRYDRLEYIFSDSVRCRCYICSLYNVQ